jgi:hypothetical protein
MPSIDEQRLCQRRRGVAGVRSGLRRSVELRQDPSKLKCLPGEGRGPVSERLQLGPGLRRGGA